jgi:hypothetical protein
MKAIKLWDQNLDAQNNLNLLLNEEKVERSFLQKLFPPKRGT